MPPSNSPKVLLLAGPPASAALWRDVQARLSSHLPVEAVELFDPLPADPTVAGLAASVADRARALGGDMVIVAHGAALPVAWRAAEAVSARALVLSDGPLTRLDPVLGALCGVARSPRLLAHTVLQPSFLRTWLSSSAGLRRAAINPYVADRDTVVALLEPLTRSSAHRLAVARFLQSLPPALGERPRFQGPTLLCWGDSDPLYPPKVADEGRLFFPNLETIAIEGGQHLHPLERPWAMADTVAEWLTRQGIAT